MNKIKNILVASVALMGLAIGTASADPLNIDTGSAPLDITFGDFNPFGFGGGCVSEFDCVFDVVDNSGAPAYLLFGGSGASGNVSFIDLLTGPTSGPAPFGFLHLGLDDGSAIWIDLMLFGTNSDYEAFEFLGTINPSASTPGAIYNEFIGIGLDVGLVLTGSGDSYFADLVAIPRTVPEPSTLFLLGAGLAGLGLSRRRSKA